MRALLLLLGCAACSFCQAGRAELFGHDPRPLRLPVPGARVAAQEQDTQAQFATRADERGEYHLLGLPAGPYVLSVEQPGFRTSRQSGVICAWPPGPTWMWRWRWGRLPTRSR